MNSSEQIVEKFNQEHCVGDWIELTDQRGNYSQGKIQAQAEVIDNRPIVALEDLGIVDLSNFKYSAYDRGYPESDDHEEESESVLGLVADSMLADDGFSSIPAVDNAEDVKFGGGDFGGGGSSSDFETPDSQDDNDSQGDDQDDDSSSDDSDSSSDSSDSSSSDD